MSDYQDFPPTYCNDISTLPPRWRFKAEQGKLDKSPSPLPRAPVPLFSMGVLPPTPDPASPPPRDPTPAVDTTLTAEGPKQPRRSHRQPGAVKNPYIVREANNLKAARNRVYALMEAYDEAKRASEAASLRVALEHTDEVGSALPQHMLMDVGSARSRSQTPTKKPAKKRKRADLELDDRYDHMYGFGDKDPDDMDLDGELNKEYEEIVARLWIEGPVTTGAVISYLKARTKLLKVVALVKSFEDYKLKHNIQSADRASSNDDGHSVSAKEGSSHTKVSDSGEASGVRRSGRSRVQIHPPQNQATDSDAPPKRKHRKKVPAQPQDAGVSTLLKLKRINSRAGATSSRATSPLSEDSAVTEAETKAAVEAVVPAVQALRSSSRLARMAKTADNSPMQVSSLLPTMLAASGDSAHELRASSHPAPGASSDVERRSSRLRSKLSMPSRFDEFVPTTIHT